MLVRPFYYMVELRKYFDILQNKVGETHSPDKILEMPWSDVVVKELNLMSFYCARELQLETGKPYSKYYTDGKHAYDLAYEESPPTRLLSLNLILSYWLGWLDRVSRITLIPNQYLHGRELKRHTTKGKLHTYD